MVDPLTQDTFGVDNQHDYVDLGDYGLPVETIQDGYCFVKIGLEGNTSSEWRPTHKP